MQPGAGAFGNAGGGFDVRRHRADAQQTTDRGADRIHDQEPTDTRNAAARVVQPGLLRDRRGGAERVEEVHHHDREQQGEQVEAESPAPVRLEGDFEAGRREALRPLRHAPGQRQHRAEQDPQNERSPHPPGGQISRDDQTDHRDRRRRVRQRAVSDGRHHRPRVLPERLHRPGRHHHDLRVHQPDEGDEQADPRPDRPAQVQRHRLHHRLAHPGEHQEEDQHAVQHHQPHRGLPRARRRGHLIGHDRVQPHAARQRHREVGREPHQDAAHARGRCRARDRGLPRHPRGLEDRRVREQNVGHRQERRHRAAQLCREIGAPPLELEEGREDRYEPHEGPAVHVG